MGETWVIKRLIQGYKDIPQQVPKVLLSKKAEFRINSLDSHVSKTRLLPSRPAFQLFRTDGTTQVASQASLGDFYPAVTPAPRKRGREEARPPSLPTPPRFHYPLTTLMAFDFFSPFELPGSK